MGSFLNQGPSQVPKIVRHPSKKDPKRDPNLENHPYNNAPSFKEDGVSGPRCVNQAGPFLVLQSSTQDVPSIRGFL